MRRWWPLAAVGLVAAAVLWAVMRPDPVGRVGVVSPFAPCPAPASTAPASTAPTSTAPTSTASASETPPSPPGASVRPGVALPRVVLPCFTEGEPVELAALGRPVVVPLWASWCRPCRSELPQLQRFATAHPSEVDVIGVVTQDTRPAAATLATDLNVSFPALFDRTGALLHAVGGVGLPVTLFIDASGRLRHVATGGTLTVSTLEALTREWLGVELR